MTRDRSISGMDRTTMDTLVNKYVSRQRVAKSTAANRESVLRPFAVWWDDKRLAPGKLTLDDMEHYLYAPECMRLNRRGKKGGEISDASYNGKRSELKPFIEWLARRRHVDDEVTEAFVGTRRTVDETPKIRLSMGQIDDAVNGCDDLWDRWVVSLAFFSMGRQGELKILRFSDMNVENNTMLWQRPKVRKWNDRMPILVQLLEEYETWKAFYESVCPDIDGTSFVIPARDLHGQGKRWIYHPDRPPVQVGRVIKKAVAHALGIPTTELVGQAAHIARRSGARVLYDQLVEAKVPDPIRIVQAMLGHAEQSTTEIYIGVEADIERRNQVLIGSDFMKFKKSNIVQLREVK